MKKERIVFIISLITILISSVISVYAASYLYNSNEVSYNNASSQLPATDVQGAIDKLYASATNYSSLDTRVTALESKVSDLIVIDKVSVLVTRTLGSSTSITAASKSGYKFIGWGHCSTSGWIGSVYVESATQSSSKVWLAGSYSPANGTAGTVWCNAIYIKN